MMNKSLLIALVLLLSFVALIAAEAQEPPTTALLGYKQRMAKKHLNLKNNHNRLRHHYRRILNRYRGAVNTYNHKVKAINNAYNKIYNTLRNNYNGLNNVYQSVRKLKNNAYRQLHYGGHRARVARQNKLRNLYRKYRNAINKYNNASRKYSHHNNKYNHHARQHRRFSRKSNGGRSNLSSYYRRVRNRFYARNERNRFMHRNRNYILRTLGGRQYNKLRHLSHLIFYNRANSFYRKKSFIYRFRNSSNKRNNALARAYLGLFQRSQYVNRLGNALKRKLINKVKHNRFNKRRGVPFKSLKSRYNYLRRNLNIATRYSRNGQWNRQFYHYARYLSGSRINGRWKHWAKIYVIRNFNSNNRVVKIRARLLAGLLVRSRYQYLVVHHNRKRRSKHPRIALHGRF